MTKEPNIWLKYTVHVNCSHSRINSRQAPATLGSPLIDGTFLVQKMCIYSCVTLSTTLLIHAVQFNARSAL